ncbi:MAG: PTS sugar transporter subunit IIC, partial [Firmicutes bacterium]|nr:PTS sugar transporter subunit IIC [Bacillota bacterium]
ILLLNAYLWTSIGIVPPLVGAGINFALPRFVMAMYQGGFMITVLSIFNALLSAVIYYPFFKILDRQACKEERATD